MSILTEGMEAPAKAVEASELKTLTIAEYAKQRSFVEAHKEVRVNANGYPFITFIDDKNVADNIYFSRNQAAKVKVGFIVDKELLSSLRIGLYQVEGEEGLRAKLVGLGETQRVKLSSLF